MTEKEQKQIFNEWLHNYTGVAFKIVRVYAITPMDRDDLFQEINIQLWHSIPAFRNASAVSTWVYRVALNTAIKWVTKERKHNQSESLDNEKQVLYENNTGTDDRLAWLYEEIYKLEKTDRSIALLLLDNFSYKEMAAIIGISESNIGVRINRIKKHLITKSIKNEHHGI
ncbi:MAG: sigma-70 family RNA polymerase sigma factor [Ferruginibacter sp.]